MLLDVKPWDDEPAMAEITNTEGLNSGATKVSNQWVIDIPNYFFVQRGYTLWYIMTEIYIR